MDLDLPHGKGPLWKSVNLQDLGKSVTSFCYSKPQRFPSLTTIVANVNYPGRYKIPKPRHNSNIWKKKKYLREKMKETVAGIESEK